MRLIRKNSPLFADNISLLTLIVVSIMAAFVYPRFSLNHDASWYLIATEMFLNGSALYIDIFEINPPLAFYLTATPITISRFFGSDPTTTYFLYCIGISFASAYWTLRILRKTDLNPWQQRGLFFAIITTIFVLPIAEFGQREHLMLIFAMPFFVCQVLRGNLPKLSLRYQVTLGLAASIGLLLKPYFLVIPAGIGLMRLWQDRNLRIFSDPAFLTIAFMTIIYLLFIGMAHPAYIDLVIPMATQVYASYGMSPRSVLLKTEIAAAVVVGIAIWRSGLAKSKSVQLLGAASISSVLAYLLQFKGWNYQILPQSAFFIITASWVFIQSNEAIRKNAAHVLYLVLVLAMTVGLQIARGPYESATTASFEQFVDAEGKSILVLSTNVSASFPFVNEVSGKWASHFPTQWLIPGAHDRLMLGDCSQAGDKVGDCAKLREILDFSRNAIINDIEQFGPDIIFVDERETKAYFRDRSFDYFEFLSEHPRFRRMRSCYKRIGYTMQFGVFSNTCLPGMAKGNMLD